MYIISCLARSACCCCSHAYTPWIVHGCSASQYNPLLESKSELAKPDVNTRLLCTLPCEFKNFHPQGFFRPESRVEVPGCQCPSVMTRPACRLFGSWRHACTPGVFAIFLHAFTDMGPGSSDFIHCHHHHDRDRAAHSAVSRPRSRSCAMRGPVSPRVHLHQHSTRSERWRFNPEIFRHPFFVHPSPLILLRPHVGFSF